MSRRRLAGGWATVMTEEQLVYIFVPRITGG